MRLEHIRQALIDLHDQQTELSSEKIGYLLEAAGWQRGDINDAITLYHNEYELFRARATKEAAMPAVIHEEVALTKDPVSHVPTTFHEESALSKDVIGGFTAVHTASHQPPAVPYPPQNLPVSHEDGKHTTLASKVLLLAEEEKQKQSKNTLYKDAPLVTTSITVFVVLLFILGYMYTEGRL